MFGAWIALAMLFVANFADAAWFNFNGLVLTQPVTCASAARAFKSMRYCNESPTTLTGEEKARFVMVSGAGERGLPGWT
jgi:hypothetical protein